MLVRAARGGGRKQGLRTRGEQVAAMWKHKALVKVFDSIKAEAAAHKHEKVALTLHDLKDYLTTAGLSNEIETRVDQVTTAPKPAPLCPQRLTLRRVCLPP